MIFFTWVAINVYCCEYESLGNTLIRHDYIYKSYLEIAGQSSNNPIHESLANHQTDITNVCLGNIW